MHGELTPRVGGREKERKKAMKEERRERQRKEKKNMPSNGCLPFLIHLPNDAQ